MFKKYITHCLMVLPLLGFSQENEEITKPKKEKNRWHVYAQFGIAGATQVSHDLNPSPGFGMGVIYFTEATEFVDFSFFYHAAKKTETRLTDTLTEKLRSSLFPRVVYNWHYKTTPFYFGLGLGWMEMRVFEDTMNLDSQGRWDFDREVREKFSGISAIGTVGYRIGKSHNLFNAVELSVDQAAVAKEKSSHPTIVSLRWKLGF